MARLTSTSLFFSTGNEITSKRWIYPLGTVKVFYQSAAPTGWTKSTTHNDKSLRVVSGNGGGSGGTTVLSSAFISHSVGGPVSVTSSSIGSQAIDLNQIPSHSHPTSTVSLSINPQNPDGSFTGGDVQYTGSPANYTYTTIDWPGDENIPYFDPYQQADFSSYNWARSTPGDWGGVAEGSQTNNHAHPFPISASTSLPSLDLGTQYIDVIICSYDG
jgi:hypothetical protein